MKDPLSTGGRTMEDNQIIELYWQRDEGAISESSRKYGSYCQSIAFNILQNNEDSEECVNDTWLKAWDSMPPHKPDCLRLFLAKITRNLSFNRYNANKAKKRGGGEMTLVLDELAECISNETDPEEAIINKELNEYIIRFVHTLPERERNIFVRRYFFVDTVKSISKRYGLSENYVSVTLNRTRKMLKKKLKKEGYIDE